MVAAGLFAVAVNAVWVLTQRPGQPLDIDEAGYASMALQDYLGLHAGGVTGWWHWIVVQPVQAPLAPALASLVDWVTGLRIMNIFAISVAAYGVVLLATLGLTREWARAARWTAFVFVAATPALLVYSRSFNFSELAAAFLAGSLYFAHRGRGFSRLLPSLAWGACLGLMLLSRTMTVAFLPGLVLAGAVPVLARWSLGGLLRFAGGLLVGAGVAATWYVHNFSNVYHYLVTFGYGAQAGAYGAPRSLLSPRAWYDFFLSLTDGYFFAGVAIFMLIGWLCAAWGVVEKSITSSSTSRDRRSQLGWIRRRLGQDHVTVSCAIVAVAGLTALMSSRNQGAAFVVPLVVPLVIVASWGVTALLTRVVAVRRLPLAAPMAGVAAATIALTVTAAGLTFLPIPGRVYAVSVHVPGNESVTAWYSASTIRGYEDLGNVPRSIEQDPGSRATGKAWLEVSESVDRSIHRASAEAGRPPFAVFSFNDRLVNVNTVELDSLFRYHQAFRAYLMNPLAKDPSATRYLREAPASGSGVTAIVTVTLKRDEFVPLVPPGVGVRYARSMHFRKYAQYWLPDGQWLVVWTPPGAVPAGGAHPAAAESSAAFAPRPTSG